MKWNVFGKNDVFLGSVEADDYDKAINEMWRIYPSGVRVEQDELEQAKNERINPRE